ncbi:Yip1 family protein [Sedimentitalea todarodis]|uniref:Yip1 family protein n=1 Tax=Sedimentitalea todarodis TaxID=1631240 RepID=A0ABU3VCE8_9RHOB|nr:Yip1 family protein [Sedimentitalea todarodis]MDU9003700.1 Yip1 family protein [Sedimentitalea todarodis]
MTVTNLRDLAILTVKAPAQASRILLSMEIPREALWTGLALVAVLNGLLFALSNLLVPGPSPLPEMFLVPVLYTALVAGGLVLTVFALFWTGRFMGGTGTLDDIMLAILWLQGLRVALMVIVIVLILTVPVLSALLVFGASIYGLYILLHFVNEAHRLNSLAKSAGVLVASMAAIVLGLTLLISLFGGPISGLTAYV